MIDIVAIRKQFGITAKTLSEALGVSQPMMCDMEKGRRGLGDHLIERCTHKGVKKALKDARALEYQNRIKALKRGA